MVAVMGAGGCLRQRDRRITISVFNRRVFAHNATNWYVKCFVFIEISMLNAIIIIKTHVRKILNRQPPSSPQPPALANDEIKIYSRPFTPH